MRKLVDIETIRKEMKRRSDIAVQAFNEDGMLPNNLLLGGILSEYYALLKFLDALPEEKPEGLSSQKMIEMWEEEQVMLKEKDFRGDAERMAYTAFIDELAKGYYLPTSEELSWNKSEETPVDLEKEIDAWWNGTGWRVDNCGMDISADDCRDFSQHFFNLGRMSKKD